MTGCQELRGMQSRSTHCRRTNRPLVNYYVPWHVTCDILVCLWPALVGDMLLRPSTWFWRLSKPSMLRRIFPMASTLPHSVSVSCNRFTQQLRGSSFESVSYMSSFCISGQGRPICGCTVGCLLVSCVVKLNCWFAVKYLTLC